MSEPAPAKGDRRTLLVLLGIAAIPRLALWTMSWSHPERAFWPDTKTYLDVALHLLHTGSYLADTALRTPVFPAFIALVYWIAGEHPWALILCQVALSIATVGLTWSLGRRLVSAQAAVLGAGLMAFNLDAITLSFTILSETTFTFLLVLTLWCWVDYMKSQRVLPLVLAAVLMALTILCRPIAMYFPVLLGLTWFIAPRRPCAVVGRQILIFSATMVGVVTPWLWHNARGLGVSTVSTVSAHNLLFYYAATVEADLRGVPDEQIRREFNVQVAQRMRDDGLLDSEANRARVAARMAMPIIKAHPFRFVFLNLRADLRSLVPDVASPGDIFGVTTGDKGTLAMIRTEGFGPGVAHFFRGQSWLIWLVLPFVGLLALTYSGAAVGVMCLMRDRSWYVLTILVFPAAYFLIVPGAASTARFKIPAVPFLSLLAGVGLHLAWLSYTRSRRNAA